MLADIEKLLDVAAGLSTDRSAKLNIAASMTVAEHLMPHWLARFRVLHPDMTIHLQACNSTEVFHQLRKGECDVGFVESPAIAHKLHSAEVARDRLVLVVPPKHPWTRRAPSAAELAATPLLIREPGSGTRTSLEVALEGYEMAAPLLELGSASAIRSSVLNGIGPAVLSTFWAVADQVRAGQLQVVDVDGLKVERSLRAVWAGPRQIEGPAAELIKLIRRGRRGRTT